MFLTVGFCILAMVASSMAQNVTVAPGSNTTETASNSTTLGPATVNGTTVLPTSNITVTVSSNITTVPSNTTTVPSNTTTVPSNTTTVPSNITTVPANNTTTIRPNFTTTVIPITTHSGCPDVKATLLPFLLSSLYLLWN